MIIRPVSPSHTRGFTIVELLIVIVVIAILAAITVVAFNGVQSRGRDSKRLSDMAAIIKSLELYRAEHGDWPDSHSNGDWDASSDMRPGRTFIEELRTSGFMDVIPVDPVNLSGDNDNYTGMHYNYFRYDLPGYMAGLGCASNKGNIAILIAVDMETSNGKHPDSPGFSCPGRNWQNEGDWVWGAYSKP